MSVAPASPGHDVTVSVASRQRHLPRVLWWAGGGALIVAFMVWVLGRWVTGPDFETVPVGPTEPPEWMKAILLFWQAFAVVGTLVLLYALLIRPWRRERVVKTDGLLVIAFGLVFFQDPLSGIFGDWFSWNAYLWNKGSWITSVPGQMSSGEPGAQVVEPLLAGPVWVWIAYAGAWAGSWVLRNSRARWPHLSTGVLIVFVLFPAMMVFDFVLEGLVAIPSGLYVYPGGHLSLFPDSYTKFPLHEAVFAGATLAGFAALRSCVDDQGHTVVERGISEVKAGTGVKTGLRLLALICATQLIPFVTYNLPQGWIAGAHSAPWPEAVQSQSYFTAGLCGAGTDRICPGRGMHLKEEAVRIGPRGELTIVGSDPAGEILGLRDGERRVLHSGLSPPAPVPQTETKADPFAGQVFGTTD